ncbi:PadR family transcriptional regulator [Salinibacterium sp. UTAS2018]|uniref:PadR family transcriptional regulator n=1 Tax=Salinibacterium sp. UTAS2018 TaxID=2508880 RepID=UPI001009810B|nr:PadR family transcriptional regulator [Salinibacterium sp. UTAS2018]QAV69910.1 PadR family transcriptional regulator [Salinibacterium sp. UTAS2018]
MSLLHAVLGFVAIQPMTGYELGKAFSTTAAHFWPADQSQLYRTLHRAEADGLVESTTVEQASRPDRRLYSILESGRAALETWLASPLEPDTSREPFLLRLFFAGSLGSAGVIALLDQRRSAAVELLTTLDALAASAPPKLSKAALATQLQYATLESGRAHAHAEITWLDELRAQLADHKETAP